MLWSRSHDLGDHHQRHRCWVGGRLDDASGGEPVWVQCSAHPRPLNGWQTTAVATRPPRPNALPNSWDLSAGPHRSPAPRAMAWLRASSRRSSETAPSWRTGPIHSRWWGSWRLGSMTTILSTRTAAWATCHRRCFGEKDRQLKTAVGAKKQGHDQIKIRFKIWYVKVWIGGVKYIFLNYN